MTPSNPDNSQPLIYRIADALGVFHLVAPVNHTHSQAEIDGLAAALAAKANAIPAGSPTGGIVIANTAGELLRSSKTVMDLENAIAAKADKNELGDSESGTFVQIDNDILRLSAYQKMVLGISEPDDEFVEISNDNIQNLRRALTNPDSTPTASSDNLITSGAVAAALTRSVLIITSNIDVEGLPVGKIIPVSYFNTSNEAKNLYDIFSFDNVTTQYKRLAINTEDVEIQSSGRAVAFIMKETNESGLGIITTLHVWYQGAGRIVNIE